MRTNLSVINNLRPFLLLLVIINHCTPVAFVNGGGILNVLQVVFGHILTPAATGLFFLISGFLYFNNVKDFNLTIYRNKSISRLKTLVLPYLIWNGICALYDLMVEVYNNSLGGDINFNIWEQLWCCNEWGVNNLNIIGTSMPMSGPADLPLWFLRDLIVVSFCTPIIYQLQKKLRHIFPVIMTFLYITQLWTSAPGFSIEAFMFFSLGAYMAIERNEFALVNSRSLNVIVFILAIGFVVASSIMYPRSFQDLRFIQQITTVLVALLVLRVAQAIDTKYPFLMPSLINKSSFFVYAIHACGLILAPTALMLRLESYIHFHSEFVLSLIYMISPFIVYGISIGYYYLFSKMFKPIMPYLTGNR